MIQRPTSWSGVGVSAADAPAAEVRAIAIPRIECLMTISSVGETGYTPRLGPRHKPCFLQFACQELIESGAYRTQETGDMNTTDALVTVYTLDNPVKAEIIKNALE